jgi:hypothetical protein
MSERPGFLAQRRSRGLTVVNSALDVITTVKDWVPNDVAQTLSFLAGILQLLKVINMLSCSYSVED